MSSLTGHRRITKRAVAELSKDSSDPLFANLKNANLQNHAVMRDLFDVVTLGHWLNFGQKHHFMRRFDGQKPYAAYLENVEWIRSNALSAARKMQERIQSKFVPMAGGAPKPASRGGALTPEQRLGGKLVFDGGDGDGVDWQNLGNACHALQDSFAGGHVLRKFDTDSPDDAGRIADVLVYIDDEDYKKDHQELDEAWFGKDSAEFSPVGRLAVEATKALIRTVVLTAVKSGPQSPGVLDGWASFKDRWLAVSPGLVSLDPDEAIRLVGTYATGTANGLPLVGHVTVNFDEDGLADELIKRYGTSMDKVHAVFAVLERDHWSDSDDVAQLYIERVQKAGGRLEDALASYPALVQKLIELLEDGWTSRDERQCIQYLEQL